MPRHQRRLDRQFNAISRNVPASERTLRSLLTGRLRYLRIPIAVLLILGGFLSVLPVFGLWMLPLGLLLLAVDVPALQPPISAFIICTRRRIALWRRSWMRARRRRFDSRP